MFTKILIANRGEIACRIIRTARAMGIHTIAIYSTVDAQSLHVQQADEAYLVGDAPAKDSYLNIASIIHAAINSGAQAIHPGYGFLSENAKFAKACHEAGIIFIGPSIAAMEAMASKQLAKQLLEKTSVPLTPGYHGSEQSEEALLKAARQIGFPVLLKAANGGGGKGMRAVNREEDFKDALAGAKREALSSFADDTMIIEKLIKNPRHIEVQIMADHHGKVVHLFERDCSVQRRHQKIIEEAPAPHLPVTLRQQLAKAACEVAQSIDYLGAGTVEFLVEENRHFYFMEMNTRLQVEHPVTEMITGLDLVAWQLKIAAGEPLPLAQEQIHIKGHAIECRIYAEDPSNEFIPSIGQLHFLKEPSGPGIRIDTGVKLLSSISRFYDPMIAKLIAWGENREEALQRLVQALTHYYIGGLKTNIPFLQAICRHPLIKEGQFNTHFLSNETLTLPVLEENIALKLAISFDYLTTVESTTDPILQQSFGWQMHAVSSWINRYYHGDNKIEAQITPVDHHLYQLKLAEETYFIKAFRYQDQLTLEYNQCRYTAVIENHNHGLTVYTDKGQCTIKRFQWDTLSEQANSMKGGLTAPMPSTVVALLKNKGDEVKAGDRLIVLEAMKMEHTIFAPFDGILTEIFYSVGSQVNEGEELLTLREASD